MITIDVADEQSHVPVDEPRLRDAVRSILEAQGIQRAQISLAVVDDQAIRRLHCEYLNDDTPTDVLSFLLEQGDGQFDGEVIVGGETAAASAARFGWPAEHELLLYVVHGTLHLVGYDDATPEQRAEMRRQERAVLARYGIEARYDEADVPAQDAMEGDNQQP